MILLDVIGWFKFGFWYMRLAIVKDVMVCVSVQCVLLSKFGWIFMFYC